MSPCPVMPRSGQVDRFLGGFSWREDGDDLVRASPTSLLTQPPFRPASGGSVSIGRLVDQCSDQSQQLLLLGAFALTEERSDLDIGYVTS